MISSDDAVQKFKDILDGFSTWQPLKDSQIVEALAIFMSWVLRTAISFMDRVFQEFFISTALRRSSILAAAEDREYIPRKPGPSTGTVRITNNGTARVNVPSDQGYQSDQTINYMTEDPLVIESGASVDVTCSQASIYEMEHEVTEEKNFYEILIDKDLSAKVHKFEVYVDLGAGYDLWTYSRLYRNSFENTRTYDEFYSHTDQIGIRFGNQTFGMIPPLGTMVKIKMWLTDGPTTLLAGQALSYIGELLDVDGVDASLDITTLSSIVGGDSMESTEEMRRNMAYWETYQEKLVWEEDYNFFLKKNMPLITWCKFWGEKQAEAVYGYSLDHINTIFVTAYAEDSTTLESDVITLMESVTLLSRKFEWVDPVIETFALTITATVPGHYSLMTVEENLWERIEARYGRNSLSRVSQFSQKDFNKTIFDSGFFDSDKSDFTVSYSGTITPTSLENFVCLDSGSTTITVDYV